MSNLSDYRAPKRRPAGLDLTLLGPFSCRISGAAGAPLALPAKRHRALLVYLAVQPRLSETRERLATLLWAEDGDENARHSLRQSLFVLRKELLAAGIDVLHSDRNMVWLDPAGISSDAAHLLARTGDEAPDLLEAALKTHRGPFAEGMELGVEAFDEAVAAVRARIRAQVCRMLGQYMEAASADPSLIGALARQLVQSDPWDQAAQRLLTKLLARQQGAGAAVAHAERFLRELYKEVGERPDSAMQTLLAELRADSGGSENLQRSATRTPLPLPASAPKMPGRLFELVPLRDLNFTGRREQLETLHALLGGLSITGTVDRVAITGLGGIGKSSLVSEYAHAYAETYSGVWWTQADERTLVLESLARLAARLDPSSSADTDREAAASRALRLLTQLDRPMLLVFDNVEAPDVLAGLLPSAGSKVIITSRWPDWDGRAVELRLDVFDDETAALFLQNRAKRSDPKGARRLASALGHLPLALDHAAAYCKLTTSTFTNYLKRIEHLIGNSPRGVSNPTSIAATFGLAIDTASLKSPAAVELLGVLAHLSHEMVPLDLIAGILMDEGARSDAVAALYEVSLIEPNTAADGNVSISVHPLVQAAMRLRLATDNTGPAIRKKVAEMLAAAFPADALTNPDVWNDCSKLLPHVVSFRSHLSANLETLPVCVGLFHKVANYFHGRGAYDDAQAFYREAAAVTAAHPDDRTTDAAVLEGDLGALLSTVGRYSEAEPMLRQAIAACESSRGPDHLEVGRQLSTLARMLSDCKRYGEAMPLLQRAIEIADLAIDRNPIWAVAWRNNLGILFNETGRNEIGEKIYRDAMTISEQRLSRDHHEYARSLNNLGRLLRDLERWEEAADYVRRALAIWSVKLGTEHPIYARGLENLANISLELGDTAAALEEARSALAVHDRRLGPSHFWTKESARTCAAILNHSGRRAEAVAVSIQYGLT